MNTNETKKSFWETGKVECVITGSKRQPVTERSEQERRQYWSEYWRKRNHIAKGCVTW